MSAWICLLLPMLAVAQNFPAGNALASLDGRAVQSATQEPILKARVTLESTADGHTSALVATTDGVGHFRFADIQPGTYRLTVEKEGFLNGEYGQTKPTGDGLRLRINAGDRITGVTLLLFPGATISGRVMDADGDPLSNATVHLWTRHNGGNSTGRSHAGTVVTNHAGEYNFDALSADTYYVSADAGTWGYATRQIPVDSTGKITNLRDLTTYYPGALSFSEAQAIKIESGQEHSDIDIRVQRGPILSVKGTIVGAGKLSSKYTVSATVEDGTGWTSEQARLLPDGGFLFDGLPPGAHDLMLVAYGANGFQEIGETKVNLTDQDVTGIVIVPFKPAQVRVRVIYEGEEDNPVTEGTVSLNSAAEYDEAMRGSMRSQLMQYQPKNGVYVIDDVPPGQYWVWFNNAGGAYLKSVESGGQTIDGRFITVNDGAQLDVKMVFSKHTASVDGEVESSMSAPDIQVLLIPEDKPSFDSSRIPYAALDQSLHFSLGHLRPGKYIAFATVQDNDSDVWNHPDFVKALQSRGTELDLPENGHATVHLKTISKDVTDRIRQQLGI